MNKRHFGVNFFFGLLIIGILLMTAMPILRDVMISNSEEKCMATARQRYQAALLYAADYDNHLPPAAHWQSALVPLISDKSLEPLSCPEVSRFDHQGLGFAMDSRLSSASLDDFREAPKPPILFFETTNLTRNAYTTGTSFAARHRDMVTKQPDHGYLITLDGNVRALNQADGNTAIQRGTL
jgi:hypothetical protein